MRVGFITDDVDIEEPISGILGSFEGGEEVQVETIDRLNPDIPVIDKVKSLMEMSDVIIFFISKGAPTIYLEIGLALGQKKKIILIANSYNLIPLELSDQKSIIMEDGSFKEAGYEILRSITESNNLNNSLKFKSWKDELYNNQYSPELSYRDLYAFSGPRRYKLFERWFSNLAKNIKQWDVIGEDSNKSRDRGFDFMLWNSSDDPDFKVFGNPIPIELKAVNTMNTSQLIKLAENLEKQGLRSIILLTTATNRRNTASFANRLKKDYGVLMVALDRDDLIDVETPSDLYFAIKKEMLNILYRG